MRADRTGTVTAQLELPAPQELVCEFPGLRLRAGHAWALEAVGEVSMRTTASGVEDADAAMQACDELFEQLLGMARPARPTRRRGWCTA